MQVALLGHSSVDEDFTYAFGLYRIQAHVRDLADVVVLDRKVTSDEDEDLALLLDAQAEVVGLSAYLWNLPRVTRLVSRLRAARPETLIVVGGPSAKGYEDLAADDARPDLLVVGPGEVTFANILRAHQANALDARLPSLGNLVSYRGGEPVAHNAAGRPENLDYLPSPYLTGLVEVDTKTLYVETDRGCPYSCAFCVESTAPNKVSTFSMERVEAELRWALERDFEHIEMCSAIFNRDTEWLTRFVELVERLDPEQTLTFSAALYSTYVDEVQADLLRRLKLKSVLFGLNSTNSETFKSVRRVIRLERFRQRIELINQFIRPEVSLIMGLPGDTPEGFASTLEFAESLDADVMVFRFMVLPATLYYEHRDRYALEIDFDNDNRILATHSYTRDELAQMEAIARAAGFEEVNPGQWIKRRDLGMQVAQMDPQAWTFLRVVLRELAVDRDGCEAWPQSWRFDRVVLQAHAQAVLKLRDPEDRALDLVVAKRDDDAPRFARSNYFNVAYRARDLDDALVRPVLEHFTRALAEAERVVLNRKRAARGRKRHPNR